MNSLIGSCFRLAVVGAVLLVGAVEARAQCANTGGGPPTPTAMLMAKTSLLRVGASWGDGNDRLKAGKGLFAATTPIDPITTHNIHITLRKNGDSGPLVFATTLPVGSFWSPSGPNFIYNDPASTFGIRRLILRDVGSGFYGITRLVGRNLSLTNMPLAPGNTLHLMIEIESGGAGDCFADDLLACSYGAASQTCSF